MQRTVVDFPLPEGPIITSFSPSLTSRLTSFAREVSDSVCRRLEPFRQDTDDPQYLQFDDMTEELKDEYKN